MSYNPETLRKIIQEAYFLCDRIGNKPNLPFLEVPPYGQRSEGSSDSYSAIINEARPPHLPEPSKVNGATAFCTHSASPHTPMQFELDGVLYPSHIVIWWYRENDKSNEYPTIIDLAQMPKEHRKPFLEVITNQIEEAVKILKKQNPNIKPEEISRYIEIYGLGGHTKPNERIATGLSRGAQSHPMGHLNVVYHPYNEYEKLIKTRPANHREFLKQIGPMDTVVFDRWEGFISNIIRRIILKNNSLDANVVSTKTHKTGDKHISFYEGFTIEFNKSQNLVSSLETLSQIINFFQGIYEILRAGYDQYYQHIGDKKEELIKIKTVIFDKLKSFFDEQLPISEDETPYFNQFLDEIIDFALSFHPTYQQLLLWENSADVSQDTKIHLSQMQKTYEKIQEISKDPEKEQKWIKWSQKFYGFFLFEAKAYLQFLYDMVSPTAENQWKNIQFTWAGQLSISYLIDKYTIGKNGRIQVNTFTIAPRFFTNKGVFEDLAGMVIDRPQGI